MGTWKVEVITCDNADECWKSRDVALLEFGEERPSYSDRRRVGREFAEEHDRQLCETEAKYEEGFWEEHGVEVVLTAIVVVAIVR